MRRRRPVACAMAVASRDAAVPTVRKRLVGSPNGSADETNSASAGLPSRRHLVALHGFIQKTRATPDEDLLLARARKKELNG
jgi:hypothetical protein